MVPLLPGEGVSRLRKVLLLMKGVSGPTPAESIPGQTSGCRLPGERQDLVSHTCRHMSWPHPGPDQGDVRSGISGHGQLFGCERNKVLQMHGSSGEQVGREGGNLFLLGRREERMGTDQGQGWKLLSPLSLPQPAAQRGLGLTLSWT